MPSSFRHRSAFLARALAAAAGVALIASAPALHALPPSPTINLYVAPAPNVFASPSYNTWRSNALTALQSNLPAFGTPGTPSFYQQFGSSPGNTNTGGFTLNVNQNVVSNFPSYQGVAAPNGPAAPNNNESGQRLTYNFDIIAAPGSTFSLAGLSFSAVTRGADVMSGGFQLNTLDDDIAAGGFTYNGNYIGINYGGDGVRGGGDDTVISSGANTQAVNEILGIGDQTAWDTLDAPDQTGTNQNVLNSRLQALNDDVNDANPLCVNGAYKIAGTSNSIDLCFTAATLVPEPGSVLASVVGGLGLLVALRKNLARRRA